MATNQTRSPRLRLPGRLSAWPTAIVALGLTLGASAMPAFAQTADTNDQAAAQRADVSRTQALSRRVEQLEEQLVDLQVVIGTLESLAKTGGPPRGVAFSSPAPSTGSAGSGELERQVQTLSQQVTKLSAEVQALQQGGVPLAPTAGAGLTQPTIPPAVSDFGAGFGATTVNPEQQGGDAIGALIDAQPLPEVRAAPAPPQSQPAQTADVPRQVYESAYNMLLQQDFAGAQAGFRAFLREHPKHALVPNALYWLGETYYVQENYTDAAEAFDIVTAAYASSNKAPDSQLKRGMALANLGKRQEACSVFRALAARYPNAPEHVKSKADSERVRVGCS